MGRVKGLIEFSGNFEPKMAEPFDGRVRVESFSDLTNPTTWTNADGNVYLYKEIIVSVYNDNEEENNGAYRLVDDNYTNVENWIKIGSDGAEPAIIKFERVELIDDEEVTIVGYGLDIDRSGRLPIGNGSMDFGFGDGGVTDKLSTLYGWNNKIDGTGYNFITGLENQINGGWGNTLLGYSNVANNTILQLINGYQNEMTGSGYGIITGWDNKVYKGAGTAASYALIVGSHNTIYGGNTSIIVGSGITLNDSTANSWSNAANLISGTSHTLENIHRGIIGGYRHKITNSGRCVINGDEHNIYSVYNSIIGGSKQTIKYAQYSAVFGGYNTVSTDAEDPSNSAGDGCDFSLISGHYNVVKDSFFSYVLGERLVNNFTHKTVLGKWNENKEDTYLEIGWGTAANNRKNIFEVYKNGRIVAPLLTIGNITSSKDLITKEYLENYVDNTSENTIVTTDNTYQVTNDDDFVAISDTTTTVNLPSSPTEFKDIKIVDARGDASANNITISGNGKNINNDTSVIINTDFGYVSMRFIDNRWIIYNIG